MTMTWLRVALALVAVVALSAGIAGWDRGWAFADQSLTPPGAEKLAPAMVIELNLGWWNSTTHVESGWVPGAIETSGKASRALGVITIVAVACGALSALYFLLLAVCNVFGVALPTKLRASPATKYKAAGLFGMISLVLTVVLYLGLTFGAHNEIKKHYGDDASVWARPDWASGCALLGSLCLLGLAYQLAPEGYEPVGYMPI